MKEARNQETNPPGRQCISSFSRTHYKKADIIKSISWIPYSLQMNSFENNWDHLKRKIMLFRNKTDL